MLFLELVHVRFCNIVSSTHLFIKYICFNGREPVCNATPVPAGRMLSRGLLSCPGDLLFSQNLSELWASAALHIAYRCAAFLLHHEASMYLASAS